MWIGSLTQWKEGLTFSSKSFDVVNGNVSLDGKMVFMLAYTNWHSLVHNKFLR